MQDWTLGIARYLTETHVHDFPLAVVEKAKECALDSLGCSLAGSRTRQAGIVRGLSQGGEQVCSIVGGAIRAAPTEAAFCNAMTADVLEIDDYYDRRGSILFAHPGACVIPAALAIGELRGSSGLEFLEAVVLGYEVCLRVGAAIQPSPKRAMEECWGCATFQTFGSVAAAGKLLKLKLEQMLNALGIAGATAPVPSLLKTWKRFDRTDLTGYAWAAEAGVRAALLAASGFTGPRDILDGNNGFWRMYGSDQCEFGLLTEGLGKDYWILDISFKPWSACRWEHPVMDAASLVVKENGIPLHDSEELRKVERVTVKSYRAIMCSPFDNYQPHDLAAGQFSTPFCAAVAMLGVRPNEIEFANGKIMDERIPELMRKVLLMPDAQAERDFPGNGGDRLSATVEIQTGKKRYEKFVPIPLGDPRNPISWERLEARFLEHGQSHVHPSRLRDAVAMLRTLESLPSVGDLGRLLV